MTKIAAQTFDGSIPDTVETLLGKANHVHQLARIGFAAQSADMSISYPEAAFSALFEVIGRLADEIHSELDELDELSPDLRKTIEAAQLKREMRIGRRLQEAETGTVASLER